MEIEYTAVFLQGDYFIISPELHKPQIFLSDMKQSDKYLCVISIATQITFPPHLRLIWENEGRIHILKAQQMNKNKLRPLFKEGNPFASINKFPPRYMKQARLLKVK